MLNRSLPPGQPVQHLLDKRGLPFYKGADGIWKAPDSAYLKGGKTKHAVRLIQPSRGYLFSDNEHIQYNNAVVHFNTHNKIRFTGIVKAGTDNLQRTIWGQGNSNNRGYYCLIDGRMDNGYIRYVLTNADGHDFSLTIHSDNISLGSFFSFDIIDDDGNVSAYINDVLIISDSYTRIIGANTNLNILGVGALVRTAVEYKWLGDIYDFQIEENDVVVLKYNCDEGAGIVAYDASGNGHHGDIVLNGTAEDAFHQSSQGGEVPSIQNTFGYNRGAYFNGVNWGNIQQKLTQKFEVNLVFRHGSQSGIDYPGIFIQHEGSNTKGLSINFRSITITDLWIQLQSATEASNVFTLNVTPHKINDITVKYDGSTFSAKNNLTGQELTWTGVINWANTEQNPTLGYDTYDVNRIIRRTGFFVCRAWELDASGNRINELINLDFTGGSKTKIKNIAVDAPENSDAVWIPADNGAYVNIPRSISNPDQDVLGNALQPSQKGLVRFEGDVLQSSVGNFDDNLYGSCGTSLGDLIGIIEDFEIRVVVDFSASEPVNDGIITFSNLSNDVPFSLSYYGGATSHSINFKWYNNTNVLEFNNQDLTKPFEIKVTKVGTTFSLYINGVLKDTEINSDSVDLTGIPFYIGVYYLSSYVLMGKIHSVYMKFGTLEVANFKFSETNGLVWYNSAKDRPANSDANIILNGSANGTQWALSDQQTPFNLIKGFSRAGYFNGINYAIISMPIPAYFEVEVCVYYKDVEYPIFFHIGAAKKLGLMTEILSLTTEYRIYTDGSYYPGFAPIYNRKHFINTKYYGGNIYTNYNNENSDVYAKTLDLSIAKIIIGAYYYDDYVIRNNNQFYSFKLWELDSSGNRIKELVNLDFAGGDKTKIKNIAADAPENSDAIWEPADGGTYINIPSNPVNNFTKRPFFYDETAYATMGDKPELQLQNFEVELRFWEEKLGTNYGDIFNLQSSGPDKGLAIYRNINSFAMWFMGNTYLNIGSFLDKQINSIRMKYYGGRFYIDVNGGHREISKAYSNQWAANGTMIGATVYGNAVSKRDKVKIYHLAYYELDASGNRVQELIKISDADENNVYNSAGIGDFVWEPVGLGLTVSFPDTVSRHKDVLGNDLANATPGTVDNNAESKILPNPNFAPELIELGIDETFEI